MFAYLKVVIEISKFNDDIASNDRERKINLNKEEVHKIRTAETTPLPLPLPLNRVEGLQVYS